MDDLAKFIPLFINGGWIVLFIGAAGMVARLATSKNPDDKTLPQILSNVFAAMVASMIAWFIMEQFDVDAMYKAITYGLVGLNSPEILSGIIKLSTKFSENPSEFISSIRGSSAKPKPKSKSKPKPKPKAK
jgi:predicted MFS family arabinose efflux permease